MTDWALCLDYCMGVCEGTEQEEEKCKAFHNLLSSILRLHMLDSFQMSFGLDEFMVLLLLRLEARMRFSNCVKLALLPHSHLD